MAIRNETKVGAFFIIILMIVGYMTLKIGGGSAFSGGKEYTVVVNSALSINNKTPVLIAGYQAGIVTKINLVDSRRAMLTIAVQKHVTLTAGTEAAIRAKGFLGETYVELMPGPEDQPELIGGTQIPYSGVGGDINQFISKLNDMTKPAENAVNSLDKFAEIMKDIMIRNEQNVNRILANFAALSGDLRATIANSGPHVDEATERIASISRKVDEGKGTLGQLVNDDKTIKKINQAADNVNGLLGGVNKLETEFGFHTEYMGQLNNFKNYVHATLKPRPDQSFLIDLVQNPNPPPNITTANTTITTGGTSTAVATQTASTERNKLRVSAQVAKQFYDWRLRGGLIENRGGAGLDYDRGPVGAGVSIWDFGSEDGRKPTVKLNGNLNITRSIYLTGGGNDLANGPGNRSWFVGGGVRVVDDDIKSLFGMSSGFLKR